MKCISKYILFLLGFTFLLTSCEDEVDIKVDPLTEQFVIDAWLTNESVPQTITLSMSQSYFDNTLPEGISGATVQVLSSEGETFDFVETTRGQYVWMPENGETLGDVGTTYELEINIDDVQLAAFTTLNRVPPIDSLVFEFRDDETFGPDGIYGAVYARDFAGLGDSYWIKTFKNGEFLNKPSEINIAFDAGFSEGAAVDGLTFLLPIRESINRDADDEEFEDNGDVPPWAEGDLARVEIHSISNRAFLFLATAATQLQNGDSGIFAEPIINSAGTIINETNPDEEVLGVFNVAAVSAAEEIVEL